MVSAALTGRAVTLEECVDSALAHNPAVTAAALEIERARIMQGTAFDPPKTEVTLKQDATDGGGPENGVYFGQEVDFPSLYVARGKSLKAATRLQESRFDLLAAEVERDVTQAWNLAAYNAELLRLNAELGAIYEEFCRVAKVRLEEGDCGPLEEMNARRVREKNEMERRSLLNDYRNSLIQLQTLTGIDGELSPEFPPYGPMTKQGDREEIAFSATIRGTVAAREVEIAERALTEARNELLPGIKIGATAQALIKGFNPYHIERNRFSQGNFMGFEVGITVPLFFGAGRARVKAADADRRIALLNMETEERKTASEKSSLTETLETIEEKLEYYRNTALPQADEIKRVALVSYEYGDIDYLEYIANLETAYEVYCEYADCLNDYNTTVNTLNYLNR